MHPPAGFTLKCARAPESRWVGQSPPTGRPEGAHAVPRFGRGPSYPAALRMVLRASDSIQVHHASPFHAPRQVGDESRSLVKVQTLRGPTPSSQSTRYVSGAVR